MIIRKDKDFVMLPEAIEPTTAQCVVYSLGSPEKNPNSFAYKLPAISYETLRDMQTKAPNLRGQPSMFSIASDKGHFPICFYPAADKDYFALLRYCPAMKEI